jgi:hypothetical protein
MPHAPAHNHLLVDEPECPPDCPKRIDDEVHALPDGEPWRGSPQNDDHPLNRYAASIHTTAVGKGWWSDDEGNPKERLLEEMLINVHSEVTEAWADYVRGIDAHTYMIEQQPHRPENPEADTALRTLQHWANAAQTEHDGEIKPLPIGVMQTLVRHGIAKPTGVDAELADVLIRVLDIMYSRGVNIDMLVREKMAYNETREYRHGGKRA